MSWTVGVHIDSTVAHVWAYHNDTEPLEKTWHLHKRSLVDGINDFYTEHSIPMAGNQLKWSTSYARHLFNKRAGDPPALIVNIGFESWPFLRQPLSSENLGSHPTRTLPLLSKDLIFGLTERTNVQGEITVPVDITELEFLAAKLKLTETKTVAVGLLHSKANPQSEKTVSEYLKSQEFEVITSHESPETSNEVARWWRTFFTAYAHEVFTTFLSPFTKWAAEKEIQLSPSPEKSPWSELILESLHSPYGGQKEVSSNQPFVFYAGWDTWKLVHLGTNVPHLTSDIGPLLVPGPEVFTCEFQPTQQLVLGPWGAPTLSSEELTLDPGPAFLGRSLRPTLADLLLMSGSLKKENLPEGAAPQEAKLKEILISLARNSKMDVDTMVQDVLGQVRIGLLGELAAAQVTEAVVVGPMAGAVQNLLKPTNIKLQTKPLSYFQGSIKGSLK